MYEGLLTDAECDHLISIAKSELKRSAVVGASRSHPASLSESRLLEDITGGISTTPVCQTRRLTQIPNLPRPVARLYCRIKIFPIQDPLFLSSMAPRKLVEDPPAALVENFDDKDQNQMDSDPNQSSVNSLLVVVGGQSSGKSLVLESIVGRDFLPRGSGMVTRRPLVLQLHKTEQGMQEYAEFLHLEKKRFTDFSAVRREIQDETDKITGRSKQISNVPIHLSIYSPNVVNLTLIDLPGLTKVAVEGQPESIVQDIENMVHSYVEKPNCIILAITPANQDIATSDAIRIARLVDPTGERTLGVLTKLDLVDKGTNALDVLEGRSYRLQHPWVGIVNRSQVDINKNVDMIAARRREREFFNSSPDYAHLASKMGSEYLANLLSKHLESVIKARIPGIASLINKSIRELEAELDYLGRPVAIDAGAQLYTILELCQAFDRIFKEHLDGGRPGGD
ncbi:hypothetical protein ACFX1T_020309 [Malus domestica]